MRVQSVTEAKKSWSQNMRTRSRNSDFEAASPFNKGNVGLLLYLVDAEYPAGAAAGAGAGA